ncbi:MAG TPA: serine hydrolase domain-containing protein [Gemmatimonadales bacterium]|nr:serine hydrolase domain-containing protein [Gemmatimonadales bacterium]
MSRKARCLAGLLGLLVATGSAHAQATIGGEWRDDVAAYARRLVDSGLTPGLAVAVSIGDWVLYSQGFGVADAATGRPVDDATAFYIASTTKALTATAVVLEAANGRLDLDAPIDRYVPGLRFRGPLDAHRVTVKQFLSMTDGLEDGGPVVVRTAYTGEFTIPLLIRLLADYGPAEGGTAFDYDNVPYNILGMALDPESEEGWKEVVRRDVLEPLGMTGTTARLSILDPERIAYPHVLVPGPRWRRTPLAKQDANQHAAGGHFATARDLARFVAAHASGGVLEGRRVFPREAIELTHQKHADQDREYGPIHRFGWGYGWDLGTWQGRTLIHRFGGFTGYHSHASFEPVSQVGVVVLVNGDGPASGAAGILATYVYDRLLGGADQEAEYGRQLSELKARVAEGEQGIVRHLAERAARLAPLTHPLADFAGRFESPKLGTMTWREVAGGLEVRMGVAESRAEVFDASKDQLRVELLGGGSVASFEFPAGGGPAAAVTMNGERFERRE